jgi:hypothetical protein
VALERHFAVGARGERAQTRQRSFFAPAQIAENLVHDVVQAVRRLGLAETRLPRHSFCDIRLLHSDSTVAAGHAQAAFNGAGGTLQPIEKKNNSTGAKY